MIAIMNLVDVYGVPVFQRIGYIFPIHGVL